MYMYGYVAAIVCLNVSTGIEFRKLLEKSTQD